MTYDKTPCEKCGEMVSTYPPLKAKHDKHCTGSAEVEAPDEAVVTTVAEKPVVIDSAAQSEMSALERDIARAQRKADILAADAPKIAVGLLDEEDELKKLESYSRETGLVPASYHVFFGDETKHRLYVGDGKIPVVDRAGAIPVHLSHGDLKMYMYPKVIIDAKLARASNESRSRMQAIQERAADRDSKLDSGEIADAEIDSQSTGEVPKG